MTHGRTRGAALLVALTLGALGVATPTAALASSAQISRAEASPDWTHAHITLAYDWAGFDCSGWQFCNYYGYAFVAPSAPPYTCQDYLGASTDPYTKVIWSSGQIASQPPQTYNVDLPNAEILFGVVGQRLCVVDIYVVGNHIGGFSGRTVVAEATLALAPPPSVLTEGDAKDATTTTLKQKYGRKFKQGEKKKIRCVEQSADSEFDCRVSWLFKDYKYSGHVVCTVASGEVATQANVHRTRR
jgi:hypothetical protein